jgi:tripartite-type tricarboxylate transporter receptor subunit TctC
MQIFLASLLLFASDAARAQAAYYQGRTISLIVGSGTGTAYDIYARLQANHIAKYIPGNPSVLVQNMPAVRRIVAAN